MRPLKLQLEGFTVYKKPQTINFEKLSFFIIQGKTGAGKTSIVDAITYALYGKVPRYGRAKAGKLVLSKGSPKLKVSLDFSVGGKHYRIERLYRRKPEESLVRAYEEGRRLNLNSSQVEKWVEKITGLDYQTFTKVILLPQGEFDKFLKPSKPKERREILINLLDLEIFEKVRQLASESYKQLEGELSVLKSEYESIKDLSEEDIKELERRKKEIEENLDFLKKEISHLEERARHAQERDKLRSELIEIEERLSELITREEDFRKEKEKLEIAKRVLPFLPYIEQLERVESELRDKRLERERVQKEKIKREEELRNIEEEKERAEKEFRDIPLLREELQTSIRELEKIKQVEEELNALDKLETDRKQREGELFKKERILKECEERLCRGEKYIEEVERELKELGYDEEEYERLLREVEKKRGLLEKKERLEEIERELTNLEAKRKYTEDELSKLKQALKEKEEILLSASIQVYAQHIRAHLKEGDTCPVCGGKYRESGLKGKDEDVEKLREEVRALQEKVLHLEKEFSSLEAKEDSLKKEGNTLRSQLSGWEEILNIDIESRLEELERKKRKKRELEKKLKKYQERYNVLLKEKESAVREVEKLRSEINTLRASELERRERLMNMFGKTPSLTELKKIEESLETKIKDLESRIKEIETRRERIKEYWEKLTRDLVAVETKLREINTLIDNKERERKESIKKLTPLFEDIGDLEKIKEVSLPEKDIKELEERIEGFFREVEKLKEKSEEIREKLKDYENIPSSDDIRRRLEEKESELESMLKNLGELKSNIEQRKHLLGRKEELRKRIEDIEKNLTIYARIKEDLQSNRLQDFASSLMLMRIVERASEYLFNFTNNYELGLDTKGDLVVIDRTQGVERDVKSLSGGETFLASLSLALGVSDVLSANAHLESLFIDEGFGSLDEETRERVSDILELIKQRINRMVGIISHIPDLAERFHQRIVVKKHGDFSTLEVIY